MRRAHKWKAVPLWWDRVSGWDNLTERGQWILFRLWMVTPDGTVPDDPRSLARMIGSNVRPSRMTQHIEILVGSGFLERTSGGLGRGSYSEIVDRQTPPSQVRAGTARYAPVRGGTVAPNNNNDLDPTLLRHNVRTPLLTGERGSDCLTEETQQSDLGESLSGLTSQEESRRTDTIPTLEEVREWSVWQLQAREGMRRNAVRSGLDLENYYRDSQAEQQARHRAGQGGLVSIEGKRNENDA